MVFLGLFIAQKTIANTPVELNETFAGNMDFVLAGGSLRQANNECFMVNGGTSSDTINLPAGASIEAAFLYWAGNGSSPDSQVTLNGQSVRARLDNIYTINDGQSRQYFSGKANVTNLISSSTSTTYTFGGLTFDTGNNIYCNNATVFAGWALVVVYEAPSEPLRVVNIFDGFQTFWGSSITLTPDNFVIDNDPQSKQGHHAHITWEGDAGNSQSRNGVDEDLYFNNIELTDNDNPSRNQFNSRSNEIGYTSGVDIDSYQVGAYLREGQTSATTVYSSGQDRVFLSAEILSVPNQPVSDLTIVDDGDVGVTRGTPATFVLNAVNNGPSPTPAGSRIEVDLADNLTLASYSGNNWSCSSNTATVACTYNAGLNEDELSADLLLTFNTTNTTLEVIDMDASISILAGEFDNNRWNNDTTLRLTIGVADLTTSAKNVEYSTLGDTLSPGSTMTYTINLNNTGNSSTSATVEDHIPAGISSFTVTSVPDGATLQTYPAPDGDFGAGYFVVTDAFVPANNSVSIVLEATISNSAQNDDTITNSATITDSELNATTVTSETVTVGQVFTTRGNKPLYLHMSNNNSLLTMRRSSATDNGAPGNFTIDSGTTAIWTLSPAVQTDLNLDYSESIATGFYIKPDCSNNENIGIDALEVSLVNATQGITIASIFASGGLNCNNYYNFQFPMQIQNQADISAGDVLQLHFYSEAQRGMNIYSNYNNQRARIELNSFSVINVNSVLAYNASYPNGTASTQVMETTSTYLRFVVSDPFGYEDISETRLVSIQSPAGVEVLPLDGNGNPTPIILSPVNSNGAVSTYQYPPQGEPAIQIPDGPNWVGQWRVTVEADEGEEGIVMARRTAIINIVGRPEPELIKTTETIWDPVNGTNNPKAIPGSDVMYTLTIRNTGDGSISNNSIVIVDVIESELIFFATDFTNVSNPANSGPIIFTDSTSVPSGLTFNFVSLDDLNDDVDFSTDGTNFNYIPQPDAQGTDDAITHIRLNPRGVMNSANGQDSPEFLLQYRVRVE